MTKTIDRPSSLRLRDALAYAALAVCTGLGLLALLLGEQANTMFGW